MNCCFELLDQCIIEMGLVHYKVASDRHWNSLVTDACEMVVSKPFAAYVVMFPVSLFKFTRFSLVCNQHCLWLWATGASAGFPRLLAAKGWATGARWTGEQSNRHARWTRERRGSLEERLPRRKRHAIRTGRACSESHGTLPRPKLSGTGPALLL
jgi:hypothetical protein